MSEYATDGSERSDSTECPTCGRDDFRSEQGLKAHHARTHGESLAKSEFACETCGETFTRHESKIRSDRAFCGKDCADEWKQTGQAGKNNPNWRGGGIECVCEWCGDTFTVTRYRGDTARFCSYDCTYTARQEWVGEDHPRWDGGHPEYYGTMWPEQRQAAIIRDGGRCRGCGITEPECIRQQNQALNVHHIRRMKTFDTFREAHRLPNLVTLCSRCHIRWEGIPLKPQ